MLAEPNSSTPIAGRQVAAVFLLYLLVAASLSVAAPLLIGLDDSLESQVISLPTAALAVLLLAWSLGKAAMQQLWNPGGLGYGARVSAFGRGMVAAAWAWPLAMGVAFGGSLLIRLLLGYEPVEQMAVSAVREAEESGPLLLAFTAMMVTVVPVTEELLFRGFLQSWLRRYLSSRWCIAVTALPFALSHYSPTQEWSNLSLILALFVLGCFLGRLYERWGTLWAPIGLHAAFNAISVALLLFFPES